MIGCNVMEGAMTIHKTSVGLFGIELNQTRRWHVIWNADDLGSYHAPPL